MFSDDVPEDTTDESDDSSPDQDDELQSAPGPGYTVFKKDVWCPWYKQEQASKADTLLECVNNA